MEIINEKFTHLESEVDLIKDNLLKRISKSPLANPIEKPGNFEIGYLKNDYGNFIGEISEVKDDSILP